MKTLIKQNIKYICTTYVLCDKNHRKSLDRNSYIQYYYRGNFLNCFGQKFYLRDESSMIPLSPMVLFALY